MVTTRSADKRIGAKGNEEKLALRSKTDDTQAQKQIPGLGTPTPSSSRKRGKIHVNVPPRREEPEAEQDDSNRDEVPDSQESPVESTSKERSVAQSESAIIAEDNSNLDTKSNNKRKCVTTEKARPAKKLATTPKSTPIAEGKHMRFGSEQPSDTEVSEKDQELTANSSASLRAAQVDNSDDDDAAPEVVSTKHKSNRASTKRKTPAKKSITFAEIDQKVLDEKDTEKHVTGSNSAKDTQQPTLMIDTTQDLDSTTAFESDDDLTNSAFVTARTTRHFDAFATPPSGTLQTSCPNHDTTEAMSSSLVITNHHTNLDTTLALATANEQKPIKPALKSTRSDVNSTTLPRKAGNTLENYRQQMLHNHLERNMRGRGNKFILQEEWSGKRRKFVVGY